MKLFMILFFTAFLVKTVFAAAAAATSSFKLGDSVTLDGLKSDRYNNLVGFISCLPSDDDSSRHHVTFYDEDSDKISTTIAVGEKNIFKISFPVLAKKTKEEKINELMRGIGFTAHTIRIPSDYHCVEVTESGKEEISAILAKFMALAEGETLHIFMQKPERYHTLRAIGVYIYNKYSYDGFLCASDIIPGYFCKHLLTICWNGIGMIDYHHNKSTTAL